MHLGKLSFILVLHKANGVASMQILVADNQSQVRFGLCVLLEQQPGMHVIGEAAGAKDLLAQSKTTCPDLILLDWSLPKMQAENLLADLRETCPNVTVIVLSGRPEARQAALDAGADGFVGKYELPEKLLAAIAQCACAHAPHQPAQTGENEEACSCY